MLAWWSMIFWGIFDALFYFSMRRPRMLRLAMSAYRLFAPITPGPLARLGLAAYLVTHADDVEEVLERSNEFLLGPINEKKILSGDFVISLDPERRYQREDNLILQSLPADRLAQLNQIVDEAAAAELAFVANPFEVVLFIERITVAIVDRFWGLSPNGARSSVVYARGPNMSADTMRLWLRKLAIVLGSREAGPFGIREVGLLCSEEFMAFVRAACANPSRRGFLAHIVKYSGADLDVAARNVAGLVMTGSAVVTKAFCHAFDQLLRFPRALERAVEAADRNNRQLMGRLLVEALRFNPVFPILPRYCVRNTTLAAGTPRETEIPAGAGVYVSPTGAMFDPDALEDPNAFGFGRDLQLNPRFAAGSDYGSPEDRTPGIYFLFGGGTHWCLGEQMAIAEMGAMGVALLRALRNPSLARGLQYDGSAVASLLIRHRA